MSLIEKFTKALAVPALIASTAFAGAAYAHGEGWGNRNPDRRDNRYEQRDHHDRGDRGDRGDRRDYRDYRDYRDFRDSRRDRPVIIIPRVQPRYDWEYGYYPPQRPIYVQPAPRYYVQPTPQICFSTGDRHFRIGGCF